MSRAHFDCLNTSLGQSIWLRIPRTTNNMLKPIQLCELFKNKWNILKQLKPKLPIFRSLRENEKESKLKQKRNYDRRHRARLLTKVKTNDKVWIKGGLLTICWNPYNCANCLKTNETYCGPPSDMKHSGIPCLANIDFKWFITDWELVLNKV
jgi:hypothetical protein